jgi:hypothetical protein
MAENPDVQGVPEPETPQPEGEEKALKKTFAEIREEARHEVLSSVDREKYEELEPEEREFVDHVCLFEQKSQKVSREHHKVKLREILLCRDVAQAYCPGKDTIGQYSEGKRILKNSETGSDSVKFVLARKVCSMLDKICTVYQSNPATFVRADMHKMETDLLNYISRLGRLIREPLGEARRVYSKLRERAGWNLPPTAFSMAEDCDVPQLFFNRYSSPSQLLLKDPKKPFRSDNTSPPLKLDFRIKNAVLIVAGENQFHLDKVRFDKVRETSAAKFIMAKSVQEGKDKITQNYKRNPYKLAEGFKIEDSISVQSIKENTFAFSFGYTLKNLPSSAARADSAELFMPELMKEENDIGCLGFSRFLYPPSAVDDPIEPEGWTRGNTRAYVLRSLFQDVGRGKIRLSMFPTRVNQLLCEHLEKQFEGIKKKIAEPFSQRIKKAEADLAAFRKEHGSPAEQERQARERIEQISAEVAEKVGQAFSMVEKVLQKTLAAERPEQKKDVLDKLRPRLVEKIASLRQDLERLRKNYDSLAEKKKTLDAQVAQALELERHLKENPGDAEARQQRDQLARSLVNGGQSAEAPAGLGDLVSGQRTAVVSNLEKIRKQFDQSRAFITNLKGIIGLAEEMDARETEIAGLREKIAAVVELRPKEIELEEAVSKITLEYEEQVGRIEEAIEVNRET